MRANLVTASIDYPGECAELVDTRNGFTLDRLVTSLAVMWDFILI